MHDQRTAKRWNKKVIKILTPRIKIIKIIKIPLKYLEISWNPLPALADTALLSTSLMQRQAELGLIHLVAVVIRILHQLEPVTTVTMMLQCRTKIYKANAQWDHQWCSLIILVQGITRPSNLVTDVIWLKLRTWTFVPCLDSEVSRHTELRYEFHVRIIGENSSEFRAKLQNSADRIQLRCPGDPRWERLRCNQVRFPGFYTSMISSKCDPHLTAWTPLHRCKLYTNDLPKHLKLRKVSNFREVIAHLTL